MRGILRDGGGAELGVMSWKRRGKALPQEGFPGDKSGEMGGWGVSWHHARLGGLVVTLE